jgi:hypothetical protein
MFQVFQMFQKYVASVVYQCCKSRSGYCASCNGYTRMFSSLCSKCFICFRRMLQVFCLDVAKVELNVAYTCMLQAYVSSVFRCFICMFAIVPSGRCIYL